MAYRNVVRSWLAASVVALTAAAPLLAAQAPAAAADSVTITVTVRDDGFSQTAVDARVGDYLIFRLDDAAINSHTLAWDQGQIRFTFDRNRPGGTFRRYGPLNAGTRHFYDADQVSGYAAGGPFTGVLTVSDSPPPPPPPPPPSSTSSTSTTVTAPPSSATTTTTMASTTSTTAPASVRPFLIPDPAPTTTTTAAPNPVNVGAGPTKNAGTAAPAANKDKDKGGKVKAAATETSASTAAAAPVMPPDSVFDPGVLTPGPATAPEAAPPSGSAEEQSLNAASVLDLLDPEKPASDNTGTDLVLIVAVGALGLLVVIGGCLWWGHRATRWDPA
jgi:hypothetical protein